MVPPAAHGGCDRGETLGSLMAAMMLMGVAVVLITQLYSSGAALALRAQARTEAEAVLEYYSADLAERGCAFAPAAAVVRLGGDPLTPAEGFEVDCDDTAPVVSFPPEACATPCVTGQVHRTRITVEVTWEMSGVSRTVRRTTWPS